MWIKVVPDAIPNADGRWIEVADQEVTRDGGTANRWLDTERAYRSFVPPGEHMVGVSSTPPEPTEWRQARRVDEDRSGESMYTTSQRNLYR